MFAAILFEQHVKFSKTLFGSDFTFAFASAQCKRTLKCTYVGRSLYVSQGQESGHRRKELIFCSSVLSVLNNASNLTVGWNFFSSTHILVSG